MPELPEVETVLRRPVTVRDDDRPAVPAAEDAASIAVAVGEATTLHRTGRIAAFYCKTGFRVADESANAAVGIVVVSRDGAEAAAARERQFRLYNADDAANPCSIRCTARKDFKIDRAILDYATLPLNPSGYAANAVVGVHYHLSSPEREVADRCTVNNAEQARIAVVADVYVADCVAVSVQDAGEGAARTP